MTKYLPERDFSELLRHAHSLKGNCGWICASSGREAFYVVEKLCKRLLEEYCSADADTNTIPEESISELKVAVSVVFLHFHLTLDRR